MEEGGLYEDWGYEAARPGAPTCAREAGVLCLFTQQEGSWEIKTSKFYIYLLTETEFQNLSRVIYAAQFKIVTCGMWIVCLFWSHSEVKLDKVGMTQLPSHSCEGHGWSSCHSPPRSLFWSDHHPGPALTHGDSDCRSGSWSGVHSLCRCNMKGCNIISPVQLQFSKGFNKSEIQLKKSRKKSVLWIGLAINGFSFSIDS